MRELEGFTRGVNFGGWLSQCDHTKERYDTFITEADFKEISERKFDHVRIPVDYELILTDDYKGFKEDGFKYLDFAIEMCKKYSLRMVLDLHRTPGYSFDPFHGEKGFFDSEECQEIFYTIWDEFAKRYGQETETVIFELLNEVTKKEYNETWIKVATHTIEIIRKYSSDMRIILGGYYNNSLEAVRDLPDPYDDKIIYTFHCYEPLIFTHQGAFWIATMDTSFRMSIDENFKTYDEYSQKYLNQAYASYAAYDPEGHLDENYFEVLIADAIKVAEERNVPLYCGEYGVIDRANKDDAKKWFKYFHAVLDKYKIGHSVWNYKQMDFEISKDF